MKGRNESVPMTRRYPALTRKQAERDAKIASRLIRAWDVEQDEQKVLDIFGKEHRLLSDPRYWEVLKLVWIVAGSTTNADTFRQYMSSQRGARTYFMTPEEAAFFDELPEEFEVYRACDENDAGISWTLSAEYAESFRAEYGKALVRQRTISKREAFAYIDRNQESEIIIL